MLRYAGGAPVLANPNLVQLERIDPSQPLAKRFVETFRLDATGLQTALRDGDIVTLLPISPQFANAVTLKGHVAQPLRYPFTPGMRIRDLIPDRDALITPDFYRRRNLLVQVIEDDDRVRTRDDLERLERLERVERRSAPTATVSVAGRPWAGAATPSPRAAPAPARRSARAPRPIVPPRTGNRSTSGSQSAPRRHARRRPPGRRRERGARRQRSSTS